MNPLDSGDRFDHDIERQAEIDKYRLSRILQEKDDIYRLCSSLDKISLALEEIPGALLKIAEALQEREK